MTLREKLLGLGLGLVLMGSTATSARGADFNDGSLRGRYTGHVTVGASMSDGTTTQRLEVQMLTALTFDGKADIEGGSSITLSIPDQPTMTCAFTITGSYALAETGLGTATLVLTPSDQTCDGGVTLHASLLLGGLHRRRLDVTINGATESSGQPLPIVGAGTLER